MPDDYLLYWHAALADGSCKVRTEDRTYVQGRLYRARNESGDPRLDDFMVLLSNETPDLLYIVRKS